MRFSLSPHPDQPPGSVAAITAQVERRADGSLWLEYCVHGIERLLVPAFTAAERTDGLWRTTCFELFFKPAGTTGYKEFNFSPSTQWAAYAFDSYRSGGRNLVAEDPEIVVSIDADPFLFLAAEPWPADLFAGEGALGLSAVIEEIDGTRSYWALAHAPGPPDFHNPACFTATLPAPAVP